MQGRTKDKLKPKAAKKAQETLEELFSLFLLVSALMDVTTYWVPWTAAGVVGTEAYSVTKRD